MPTGIMLNRKNRSLEQIYAVDFIRKHMKSLQNKAVNNQQVMEI